jgi:hypothetical protein
MSAIALNIRNCWSVVVETCAKPELCYDMPYYIIATRRHVPAWRPERAGPEPSAHGVMVVCYRRHPTRGCQLSAYRDLTAARTHRQITLPRASFGYHRTHQNYADGDFDRLPTLPTVPI